MGRKKKTRPKTKRKMEPVTHWNKIENSRLDRDKETEEKRTLKMM